MPVRTVVLLLLAAAAAAWWLVIVLRRRRGAELPVARRSRLLSPAARQFLRVLDEVAGPSCRIHVRVSLADVLRVTRPPASTAYRRALAQLQAHQADFVLCEPGSAHILGVVQLDERSRHQPRRGQGDAYLAEACRIAGMPVLSVIARREYDIADIRGRVRELLQTGRERAGLTVAESPRPALAAVADVAAPPPPRLPAAAEPAPARYESVLTPTLMASITRDDRDDVPACPRCGAVMVRRHVHIGSHPGGDFWTCIHAPRCRGIVPIIRRAVSSGP